MIRQYKKNEKIQIGLFALSVALMILGIMFLLNAMAVARIFPAYYDIPNVLAKYIVVIATMASGIMLFSNVAIRLENKKWRNGLTGFITTFSTVLTLPLVYVFVALFPYQANGAIGAVGKVMGVDKIAAGFIDWFGTNPALIYTVYAFMLVIGIVFIAFPLVTGVLGMKGKTIKIGKQDNGKFGVSLAVLPVIAKAEASCTAEDCACCCGCHGDMVAEMAADTDDSNK
ncbi:MAG: hypothetical protein RSB09_04710 [Clostridia bacterium]